jgi:hypothetical protein
VVASGALALVFAVLAAPLAGQSAAEVIERMLEEHERRSAGVTDYTLVQAVMGVETVSHFVKQEVEGRSVFRLQSTAAGGIDVGSPTSGTVDEIYAVGEELARSARYAGREDVDGVDTHVLEVDDLGDTEFGRNISPDSDFEATSGRFWIDAESYVPRRMEFQGEMTNDEGTHPITSSIDMSDYRDAGGMLVPYRTVVSIQGFDAAIDDETRARFEEMERELESLPPDQRRMMETMMAGQLEQFRAMMGGSGEAIQLEVTVVEVRVNEGPPGA